ncbi:MAG: SCO family protein [Proteobacteria bacterium]|nr:SCO family protein [Pseudomonadota bacterium]MBU1389937.1 SCO family protein [Pseudomonadota bacterium]MBU1542536.1 SCO family protein [Pseudomonadota bacterium]MBU2429564.1 SCO family protein [Pseudomonadota bacterium]MBU2479705.1 SCO family protein [Pseudomonadota bacterium]
MIQAVKTFIYFVCAGLIFTQTGSARADTESHDHSKMMVTLQQAREPVDIGQVRVDERTGEFAALDTVFADSAGRSIQLEQVFDKPVVLLPIFFSCTAVCNFLQADLARALNEVGQMPGKDFNIVTFSFADDEDSTYAAEAKHNFTHLITREFDFKNWYYLTGDSDNIRKLTDSLGYYFFKKAPHFYIHPSALIVLAGDGRIIRYLYGPGFLPFDLGMAISEAEKGEPGVSIKSRVLSFCFGYDPENRTYVFRTFRIAGSAILVLLAAFIVFLVYPSKRDRKKKT